MGKQYLGIDIAKANFEVALGQNNKYQTARFSNDEAGFEALSQWLKSKQKGKVGKVWACMESTSVYGQGLAAYLFKQQIDVSVVNPRQIKYFGQSLLTRNKTDKADAQLIAKFCEKISPRLWQPLEPGYVKLQALVRSQAQLEEMGQKLRNQLQTNQETTVVSLIEPVLVSLTKQLAEIKQAIEQQLEQEPALGERAELVESIPGIGAKTSASLLAELPQIEGFSSAKAVAAYAGVTPQQNSSGKTIKASPLSKQGNSRIRKLLFFPAITAMKHNPLIKALSERLLAKGKPKAVVIGAAMRKLLHLVYGVLKHRKPFDPTYEHA